MSSKILPAPRDAMQRTAVVSGGDLAIGLLGLRKGQVPGERDDAVQLGIEALQAIQIQAREALRCELARFDPSRQERQRSEGDVLVILGKGMLPIRSTPVFGTNEAIACRAARLGNIQDPSVRRARRTRTERTCAVRCGVRTGEPSICANCQRLVPALRD